MTEHVRINDAYGMAALGICESMLLALTDLTIISNKDVRDLLSDVATTHTEAATKPTTPASHQAVVEIVVDCLTYVGVLLVFASIMQHGARRSFTGSLAA